MQRGQQGRPQIASCRHSRATNAPRPHPHMSHPRKYPQRWPSPPTLAHFGRHHTHSLTYRLKHRLCVGRVGANVAPGKLGNEGEGQHTLGSVWKSQEVRITRPSGKTSLPHGEEYSGHRWVPAWTRATYRIGCRVHVLDGRRRRQGADAGRAPGEAAHAHL